MIHLKDGEMCTKKDTMINEETLEVFQILFIFKTRALGVQQMGLPVSKTPLCWSEKVSWLSWYANARCFFLYPATSNAEMEIQGGKGGSRERVPACNCSCVSVFVYFNTSEELPCCHLLLLLLRILNEQVLSFAAWTPPSIARYRYHSSNSREHFITLQRGNKQGSTQQHRKWEKKFVQLSSNAN